MPSWQTVGFLLGLAYASAYIFSKCYCHRVRLILLRRVDQQILTVTNYIVTEQPIQESGRPEQAGGQHLQVYQEARVSHKQIQGRSFFAKR